MRVVNWNVQWATPASARSPEILCHIQSHDPDIVCLTETDCRLLASFGGHAIEAAPDPGTGTANYRRKVLLWSQRSWMNVDGIGIDHIATSGDLSARSLSTIDHIDGERRLSDHFGVVADLSVCDTQQNPQ